MFDLKLIIAGVIVLALAGAFLFTNSTVGKLVSSTGFKINEFTELSNISFSLSADRYGEIKFDSQKKLDVEIHGKTKGNIGDGSFDSRGISMEGFSGKGSVGNGIVLNGSVDVIRLSDASIIFKGKRYDSYSEFSNVTIDSLALKELNLENVTGSIRQNGAEIRFSNAKIILQDVSGKFSFGTGLDIDGHASRVSIPNSGIVIS